MTYHKRYFSFEIEWNTEKIGTTTWTNKKIKELAKELETKPGVYKVRIYNSSGNNY